MLCPLTPSSVVLLLSRCLRLNNMTKDKARDASAAKPTHNASSLQEAREKPLAVAEMGAVSPVPQVPY